LRRSYLFGLSLAGMERSTEGDRSLRETWRSLVRLFEGSHRLVVGSLGISVLQSLLLVPIAFLVRRAFDVSIPDDDTTGVIVIGVLILALFIASMSLGLLTRRLALRATNQAITNLRSRLVGKVYSLPRAYFDRSDLGTLHATIVQDSDRLDLMAIALVSVLMPVAVITVALSITLIVIQPVLAALLLVIIPALIVMARTLNKLVRRRTRRWQRAFDAFSTQTQLALRSLTLTKLHGAEQHELERQTVKIAELGDARTSMAWAQALHTQLNGVIAAAGGVIVLVVGGVAVANGSMSMGDLISFYAVLGLLRNQLLTGGVAAPAVISGVESLARLEKILAEEDSEAYRGTRTIDFTGGVALEDVSFEYVPGEPVLRDVTMEIAPGEVVALLGPIGAGKSTIINLFAGLYAPQRGTVLADEVPLAELDLTELRRRVGVIVQDPFLFPTSVRDNLAFGRPETTQSEIEAAARRVGAHEFIEELPGGYEARIGDDGVLLSGGQRQKLALARSLLGNPALLMLDEPTTHLDRQGIEELLHSLVAPGGPTILMVTHDPAVAASVDRIMHLRDGRLWDPEREQGPAAAPSASPRR
jgi:ATP-binding cassette, subfamily B, bacterial